ncbi:hypothetical protein CDL12_06164 [Handroanthus impetiginosus]|uniref:Uncharacterized protein n=1 Tax=Handroanthus impetiginosus TaxID=429701 RepID=A0A2G9HUF0_9LAMI|nr:hypothetical protein CDL12_06164 [Handroanthus impetiginosus]
MLHKENYTLHDRMAGRVPLEVGTRGTIGSLLKREIEYFRKLEVERVESSMNSERMCEERAAAGRNSWRSFRFPIVAWRRKKRRNSGIRPGICSMVEVADNEMPGFSYQNLRIESMRFDV